MKTNLLNDESSQILEEEVQLLDGLGHRQDLPLPLFHHLGISQ